jgi:hypothetical protein
VTSEAAQLAEALRAGKKARSLSGAQIAEQIERLTGSRPSLMWVTRRLRGTNGRSAMIRLGAPCQNCGEVVVQLDPMLAAMADVLGVDVDEVLAEAAETPEMSAAIVDANLRAMGSAGLEP